MRHSRTAGRVPGSARRLVLGSLGAGLAVATAAPMASAATSPVGAPAQAEALVPVTAADWSQLGGVKLYPLAGTPVDPLSNVVGTDLGGVPVSTRPVNGAFAHGLPISELPVIGRLFG